MKRTIYIFIILLTISCNHTTSIETNISRSQFEYEIINFYKYILENDIDSTSYVANRPGFLIMNLDSALICNDSLFNSNDWELMSTQKKIFKDFKIEKPNTNFIEVDSLLSELKKNKSLKKHWEILDKHYSGLGFYSYSLPYFNKTRNLVIIEMSFNCNGLCGYGTIRVFEKKNNEWKYLKTISHWNS